MKGLGNYNSEDLVFAIETAYKLNLKRDRGKRKRRKKIEPSLFTLLKYQNQSEAERRWWKRI